MNIAVVVGMLAVRDKASVAVFPVSSALAGAMAKRDAVIAVVKAIMAMPRGRSLMCWVLT
ncbi:glycerol-3-phosphate ABC transporter receptor protein [Leifsonia xyli subsp. cynodontis DSM 46306]|uniref:Uncharacterized protein n=1 Tax=Leifsonia xyli subsp. cynodontis DSM 46306 TaxID=1389489 RepID=U3PAP9_LEIXC|nr:hypothetical protein [Leifsonia xyli]AGW40573.1 glycerol-3-phosphate ABC transporter receptor protein [Leifsonia xyli subsp. cynodontis DSM 46306]